MPALRSLPRRNVGANETRPLGPTGHVSANEITTASIATPGRPLPALQGLDRHGLVLFIGSFSKVMFPSLRLGYIVVPPDLVDHFAAVKSVTTRHAPVLEQAVLCDFISEGHFGRHVRRMREVYAERLSVLMEVPLSRYSHGRRMRQGLHLGFAAVDGREIRRGVQELATVLKGLSR